ncbi:metallophosphoesterase [Stenotrophomonas sp.]|uniref:metallophosphoesterase n=1 Tax=Stenotrophomonas sp. TaxID=69392 RepID=UPI0025FD26FE|nr:metallophosphoesterase [Stenotrophomonas sp.]
MRILVLSDLHFEVWRDAPKRAHELLSEVQTNLDISKPDLVVLAGDIDTGDRAVAWADQAFPNLPVVYVQGNHEAYGQKFDMLKAKLADACAATGHVHFLDKGQLVVGNVRFLGATLWTDFQLVGPESVQEAMQSAAAGMNDYRKIRLARAGFRKIKRLDVAQWHWEERIWLEERLEEAFAGTTVVVTHMAPSLRSIPEKYKGHVPSAAFASHLDALVSKADLWVHGHVHDSTDYLVGKSRVVCNPLGYPRRDADGHWLRENALFDPNLIVEVGGSNAAERILQDSATLREALASEWLSASQVGVKLGVQPCDGNHTASQLRREGKLLGVYITQPVPSYRYPPWQFQPDGRPVDHLAKILELMREFGPFQRELSDLRRTTGWGEVEWFLSPHALLDGATPAGLLIADPLRVLRAAHLEFQEYQGER